MYLIIEITYKSVDSNSRDATAKCIDNIYSYGLISAALDKIAANNGIILQNQPWEIEKPLSQYTSNPMMDANYVMFDDPWSFTVYKPKEKGYLKSHIVLRQVKRVIASKCEIKPKPDVEIRHANICSELNNEKKDSDDDVMVEPPKPESAKVIEPQKVDTGRVMPLSRLN